MPQDRILLHHGARLRIERVVLHATGVQWSASYRAASSRLVLPASGATEFSLPGETVLLDGITVLRLPGAVPYRMKPLYDAARANIVVSGPDAAGDLLPAQAWLLPPRAIWSLRRHWRALGRGDAREDAKSALLQALLASGTCRQGGAAPAVQRAQRFMAEAFARRETVRWTLAEVADAACCSPFHLARIFRRDTGLSLHGYRQRLRIAAALQRIEDGERSVAALAHDLGFSSQSHLGEAFRRDLGATPATVRAQLVG